MNIAIAKAKLDWLRLREVNADLNSLPDERQHYFDFFKNYFLERWYRVVELYPN